MKIVRTSALVVLSAGAAAVLLVVGTARASLILDDFDYPTGALSGRNGGEGWSGSWGASTGGRTSRIIVYGENLTYAGGGYAITQTGTGYVYGNYNAFRGINRYIDNNLTGTVWFSILLRNDLSTDHVGIQFNNHADAPYSGNDYERGGFDVGLHGTNLIVRYGGVDSPSLATLALGQTHLIVGRWVVGAGNDFLSVWADPASLTNLGPALFDGGTANVGDTIYLAGVFAWGASQTGREGLADAIRLSDGGGDALTAFNEVTGLPEPATMALVLVGMAAIGAGRRRR